MAAFLDRNGAREFLNEQGVPMGPKGLANLASDGAGPRYAIINGRALYTRENLIAWIDRQAAAIPRRRRDAQPSVA